MARLEEIREKLYRKKFTPPPAPRDSAAFDRRAMPLDVPRSWQGLDTESPSLADQAALARARQRQKSLRIIIGTIVVILIGASAVLGYLLFLASTEVTFSVLGPSEVVAGEPTVVTVRIANNSRAALAAGGVTLTFPPGTITPERNDVSLASPRQTLDIPAIPPGGEFLQELRVRLLGTVGEAKIISGVYRYQPENIQSELTRSSDFSATIARVPVALGAEVPERVNSGQEVTLVISVDSELSLPLAGMSLGVEFPEGFELKSTNPLIEPGADRIWPLAELELGTSRTISVTGILKGEPEEAKAFRLRLGYYERERRAWLLLAEHTANPTIASPFLFARTTLAERRGGSITPGETLIGAVRYRNNLTDRIQNLEVRVSFPEKFVDLKSIRAERGFYDVTKNAVTWNSASEPRLSQVLPGEEGTLAFSVALKSVLPVAGFQDKNFVFPVVTTIDSASPPPQFRGVSLGFRDVIDFRISSPLGLSARASYYDASFPSSGPLPPQVRKTTTYAIILKLTSGANALFDVEVRGQLAGGVMWQERTASDLGAISFNPATQEFVWRIREVPAATGILRAPLSAAFQVALTPAENQLDTSPLLVKNLSASGRDTFADTVQSDSTGDIDTQLRQDARSNASEWRVVP